MTVDTPLQPEERRGYIVIKVEGRQSVGSRMPQVGGPLDAIDLANLRNWIAVGAPNN